MSNCFASSLTRFCCDCCADRIRCVLDGRQAKHRDVLLPAVVVLVAPRVRELRFRMPAQLKHLDDAIANDLETALELPTRVGVIVFDI